MGKEVISAQAVNRVLGDFWGQYKSHKLWSFFAFFSPAVGSVLVVYIPPLIIGNLVNVFIASNQITLGLATNYLILFFSIWLFGEFLWRVGIHYLIKLEAEGTRSLAMKAFNNLLERDYNFYSNHFVGSLSKKAFTYSRNFESFTDTLVFNIFTDIFPIIFVIIVLSRYSFWLPLILMSSVAIVITIAIPIIKRRSKLVAARHDSNSKMVGRLSDALSNIMAIKSFAKEKREYETYGDYVQDFSEKFKKAANYQNLNFETIISPIYVTTNVIGLIAAIYFAEKLGFQPGTIVIVFAYFSQITRIFWEVNHTYRQIESSITESAEFVQLFLAPSEIRDSKKPKNLITENAKIEFLNINFGYCDIENKDDKKNDVFLSEFNLCIPSKQKVGLVGPSGGGKTTITKLLLRFVDCSSGQIKIDGQDIKEVTQTSLRDAIAYVPQEPLLFHRTLFENIAYGNEKATEKDVIKAAKLAHAEDFIKELPKGYQTLVGERGIKLSGGQRQRIAIARALLKQSPILVLDEATSSLDSESEKYIQEGLRELMKDKTALVIAHRLSTIKHLDRIIVLENGKIVQDGTHDELIKQKGLYATLWGHQSGGGI